jgi:hypothetical protein
LFRLNVSSAVPGQPAMRYLLGNSFQSCQKSTGTVRFRYFLR